MTSYWIIICCGASCWFIVAITWILLDCWVRRFKKQLINRAIICAPHERINIDVTTHVPRDVSLAAASADLPYKARRPTFSELTDLTHVNPTTFNELYNHLPTALHFDNFLSIQV